MSSKLYTFGISRARRMGGEAAPGTGRGTHAEKMESSGACRSDYADGATRFMSEHTFPGNQERAYALDARRKDLRTC